MLQLGDLGAGHLPVFFAIIFTLTLGSTYVFAVWRGDVDPVFPYISAEGDHRPESCFFSMMLNLSSFLSMLIIYLRYSLVSELNRSADLCLKRVNELSLVAGLLGAFGMFLVANFQETAVLTVHLVSAFVCFGSGCVYMIMQAYISVHMHPLYANRRIGVIRSLFAIVAVTSFFVAVTFGVLASNEFHKYYPHLPTPRPWSRKKYEPGYELHCISAMAEWLLAVCNVAFLLSYSRDFEKIQVELGVQPLVAHLDQSPLWRSAADLGSISG
uniref:DNA damage-regulated autophagy modulator protein 1 n=1 Tax=Parascaris univalens TaxID=6257 RepID=A0A914ZEG8_PARUN